MTIALWPNVFTGNVSKITAAFGNYVRTNLAKAIDGVGGGTYTPSSVIEINGSGIQSNNIGASTHTGAQQFDADATFDGNSTFNGPLIAASVIIPNSVISPAAMGSQEDDWSPTDVDSCNVIRATGDAGGSDLTGIDPGDGSNRIVFLCNVGGGTITLQDQSVSSAPSSRFAIPGPIAIGVDESVTLFYDATSTRWRVLGHL